MKGIIKFLAIVTAIFSAVGCNEYEMVSYDQEDMINFMTFDQFGGDVDDPGSFVWEKNFCLNSKGDSLKVDTLRVGVKAMGLMADHDRKVSFTLVNLTDNKLEVEYMPEGYVIPAGKGKATFKVVIKRPALDNVEYSSRLMFDYDNSDFKMGTVERQGYSIKSSDIVNLKLWNCDAEEWKSYIWDLGTYSETKIRFIINVLGVVDFNLWAPYFDINKTNNYYVDLRTLFDTWVAYKAESIADPVKYPPFYDETKLPALVWIEFPEPW